jgi:hypothetical protein
MGNEVGNIERNVPSSPADVCTTVMPQVNARTGFCAGLTTLLLDSELGRRVSPSQRT